MLDKVSVVMVVFGFVCAAFAAFRPQPEGTKPHMGWAAIMCLMAALITRGLTAFGL